MRAVLILAVLAVAGVFGFFVYVAGETEADRRACASPEAYAARIKQGSLPDCRK